MNFTLGLWYMVVAQQMYIVFGVLTGVLSVMTFAMVMAFAVEGVQFIKSRPAKWIIAGVFIGAFFLAVLPRNATHAAFMMRGQVAVAEGEGRAVPAFKSADWHAINTLADLYLHNEYANVEKK